MCTYLVANIVLRRKTARQPTRARANLQWRLRSYRSGKENSRKYFFKTSISLQGKRNYGLLLVRPAHQNPSPRCLQAMSAVFYFKSQALQLSAPRYKYSADKHR